MGLYRCHYKMLARTTNGPALNSIEGQIMPTGELGLERKKKKNRKGRPLGRWEYRVKEYVSERGVRGNGLEWARRECMDRERWRSVCRGHFLGGHFRRERGVGAIE